MQLASLGQQTRKDFDFLSPALNIFPAEYLVALTELGKRFENAEV